MWVCDDERGAHGGEHGDLPRLILATTALTLSADARRTHIGDDVDAEPFEEVVFPAEEARAAWTHTGDHPRHDIVDSRNTVEEKPLPRVITSLRRKKRTHVKRERQTQLDARQRPAVPDDPLKDGERDGENDQGIKRRGRQWHCGEGANPTFLQPASSRHHHSNI